MKQLWRLSLRSEYDVVIVGAGLIGASLALQLAEKSDLSIAVLERSSMFTQNPSANQRVVALGAVASNILKDIDIFQQLDAEHCNPYHNMFVWDENSNGQLDFSATEHGYQQLGYMIDSNQCVQLLHEALQASPNLDVYFGMNLENLSFANQQATVQAGEQSFSTQLLIAADGARSWVRQASKIFANHHSYKQQGIVALISTEQAHRDTAWQRFLSTGPIAVLPLNQNRSSIVWSASDPRSKELMALEPDEFELELSRALDSKLGAVTLLSDRVSFPLQSLKADSYVRKNLALIGDAAHSIHPLAGQGANLGFKDIQCLIGLICAVDSQRIGGLDVLSHYQRERRFDNQQTDAMMSALHSTYLNDNPAWMAARGAGMNLIADSTLLKQLFVRQAIGV